jgi:hypothetical protein
LVIENRTAPRHELEIAPAECMMIAAHVGDTIGVQSAGYGATPVAGRS